MDEDEEVFDPCVDCCWPEDEVLLLPWLPEEVVPWLDCWFDDVVVVPCCCWFVVEVADWDWSVFDDVPVEDDPVDCCWFAVEPVCWLLFDDDEAFSWLVDDVED